MRRLLKIAAVTVLAFLGVSLTVFGVHLWLIAHPTTTTVFDPIPADAMPIDNSDWVDKGFIRQRFRAAMTLYAGVSVIIWAVFVMRKKKLNAAA